MLHVSNFTLKRSRNNYVNIISEIYFLKKEKTFKIAFKLYSTCIKFNFKTSPA